MITTRLAEVKTCETRQVYNLLQDLWNRFPYFEGWGVDAKSLGVKAGQTDRHQSYRTGGAFGASKNPSCENFVRVIILVIYQTIGGSGTAKN